MFLNLDIYNQTGAGYDLTPLVDSTAITENVTVFAGHLSASVVDTCTITEDATELLTTPPCSINIFDATTVTEFISTCRVNFISIYDSCTITENTSVLVYWKVLYSVSRTGSGSGAYSNYTFREPLTGALQKGERFGSKLRVRLLGNTTSNNIISAAYLGQGNIDTGDWYDFASAPTQLLYQGGAIPTLTSGFKSVVLDEVDFIPDGSSPLVFSHHNTAIYIVNTDTVTEQYSSCTAYKAGNEASTIDVSGFSATVNYGIISEVYIVNPPDGICIPDALNRVTCGFSTQLYSPSLASTTCRVYINASKFKESLSKFTVEFSPYKAAGAILSNVWIGNGDTVDPYDFTGDQVQLKFSGNTSVSLDTRAVIRSDSITYNYDNSKNFVVGYTISNCGYNYRSYADCGSTKYGASSPSVTNNTAGTEITGVMFVKGVVKDEIPSDVLTISDVPTVSVVVGAADLSVNIYDSTTTTESITVNNVVSISVQDASGSADASTSYSNPGGTGIRASYATVSNTATFNGAVSTLVDGSTVAYVLYFNPDGFDVTDKYIKFTFIESFVIDEAKWYQSATNTHGTWKWQGSNNDADWSDIGSSFTLGGSTTQTQTQLNGNTTAYKYYRLLGVSGNASWNAYLLEVEFKISKSLGSYGYSTPLGSGDRSATITVSVTPASWTGTVSNLVNGNEADNNQYPAGTPVADKYIKFDFGSAIIITEAINSQDTTQANGTWKWQGSNNDTDWSDIGGSFTFGGALINTYTELSGNTTAYRYYRMYGVSGNTSTAAYVQEFIFKTTNPNYGAAYVTVSENVTVSVSVASLDLSINTYDSCTLTESVVTDGLHQSVSIFDTCSLSELLTRSGDCRNSVFDTIAIAEFISFTGNSCGISCFDAVTITENITRTGDCRNLVFDAVTITENITALVGTCVCSCFDSVTVSENTTGIVSTCICSQYDTITVSEYILADVNAASAGPVINISIYDNATILDVTGTLCSGCSISVFDGISISEFVSGLVPSLNVSVYSSAIITESITTTASGISAETSETVSVVDLGAAALSSLALNVAEVTLLSEATISEVSAIKISIFDVCQVLEYSEVYTEGAIPERFISTQDSVTVADITFLGIAGPVISVFDMVTLSEQVVESVPLTAVVVDTVTVSESVTGVASSLILSCYDTAVVSEVVSGKYDCTISKYDSVLITDIVTPQLTCGISVYDSSTITESVAAKNEYNISTFDAVGISESTAYDSGDLGIFSFSRVFVEDVGRVYWMISVGLLILDVDIIVPLLSDTLFVPDIDADIIMPDIDVTYLHPECHVAVLQPTAKVEATNG